MSQTTHPVSINTSFGARRTAILVGLLGLVAAALVVVALMLSGSDANTAGSLVSDQPASLVETNSLSGSRFDGGPEEGTRGATAPSAASTRFDGGPEEGTRGATLVPATR